MYIYIWIIISNLNSIGLIYLYSRPYKNTYVYSSSPNRISDLGACVLYTVVLICTFFFSKMRAR